MSEAEPTHLVFIVRLPEHAKGNRLGYIDDFDDNIAGVGGYFTRSSEGFPVSNDYGTYEVHAPSWATLDIRHKLVQEGFVILLDYLVPGSGIPISVEHDH